MATNDGFAVRRLSGPYEPDPFIGGARVSSSQPIQYKAYCDKCGKDSKAYKTQDMAEAVGRMHMKKYHGEGSEE